MKGLIKTAAVLAMFMPATFAMAQDEVEVELGADLVSNYIWRGQDLGSAAIQPSLGVSYKGLSLEAWGSYGIVDKNDDKEIDLTLSYTTGGFTVGVTDYFISSGAANCDTKYFLYDAHKTAHSFEANLGYDFGVMSLNWYTNIAGADAYTAKGKRAYTSYCELAAPFTLGGLEWEAQLGFIPYSANTGYYEDVNATDFAVTNVSLKASKEIKITDSFKVPMFASLAANPSTQKMYFTAGISF